MFDSYFVTTSTFIKSYNKVKEKVILCLAPPFQRWIKVDKGGLDTKRPVFIEFLIIIFIMIRKHIIYNTKFTVH